MDNEAKDIKQVDDQKGRIRILRTNSRNFRKGRSESRKKGQ